MQSGLFTPDGRATKDADQGASTGDAATNDAPDMATWEMDFGIMGKYTYAPQNRAPVPTGGKLIASQIIKKKIRVSKDFASRYQLPSQETHAFRVSVVENADGGRYSVVERMDVDQRQGDKVMATFVEMKSDQIEAREFAGISKIAYKMWEANKPVAADDMFAQPAEKVGTGETAKEPWQMSLLDYGKSRLPAATAAKITSDVQVASYSAQHIKEIKAAIARGDAVPAEVLHEYRGQEWADVAAQGKEAAESLPGEKVGAGRTEAKASRLEEQGDEGYTDPYELTETRLGTTDAQREAGRGALRDLSRRFGLHSLQQRSGDAHRGKVSLLGARLIANFSAGRPNALIGQHAKSARDLAALAQVYRDPRIETLRVAYLSGNKIVGETGYTSRLPGAVRLPEDFDVKIAQGVARFGADGFYLLHNHPSGSARPSPTDINLTTRIAALVPGFRGHVVIDHNEYAVISRDFTDREMRSEVIQDDTLNGTDFTSNPAVPHNLLGVSLTNPRAVAGFAKELQTPQGYATLVLATRPGEVQLIVDVPMGALNDTSRQGILKGKALIRRMARDSGSSGNRFIILPDGVDMKTMGVWAREGVFTDVVSADGVSFREKTDASVKRDFIDDGRVMEVREDSTEKDAYGQTKETDTGKAMFNAKQSHADLSPVDQQEWLSDAQFAQVIEERIAQFRHQPPVLVVGSVTDVPGMRHARAGSAMGVTTGGKIYLIREANATTADIVQTLWHELVHYGLRRFMTKEHYIAAMHRLYERDAWIKGKADAWLAIGGDDVKQARKEGDAYARARGVDEALALLAETSEGEYRKNGPVAKAIRMVVRWIAMLAERFGFHEAAARYSGVSNDEDRALVRSLFHGLREDAEPSCDAWGFTSDPAFKASEADNTPSPDYGHPLPDTPQNNPQVVTAGQGRLLAPNGKPSHLNARQWAQVRSPALKAWFGDWELAGLEKAMRRARGSDQAKAEKHNIVGKQIKNRETEMFATVSGESFGKMLHSSGLSVSTQAHMQALGNLDKLFPLATLTDKRAGKKQNDVGRIASVHHFAVPMPFDGDVLVVKILAKQFVDPSQGNRLYLVEAVEIETPASYKGESDSSVEGRSPHLPAGVSERLRQMIAAVKGEGVSKVIDENGEPRVVYHGTNADFPEFSKNKIKSHCCPVKT